MRTLIVEDDISSRVLLEEMLAQYGPVHQAMNGAEAIESFRHAMESHEYYDLICLDIMLPKMNGQEVLRIIRNIEKKTLTKPPPHAKVIMISVLKDTQNIISAFKGHCDGYLIKPFHEEKLIATLKQLQLIET